MERHHPGYIRLETYALVKAYKYMQGTAAAQLAPLGLYPGQDRLLSELWAEDGITQTELAKRLDVELPTVTKALQRLERVGLIRRERATHDQRQMLVSLTGAGHAVQAPVEQAWQQIEEQMLRGLSPTEREQLGELLMRMVRNLSG